MTTALQRLLNVVFILIAPIPVLIATQFFLEGRYQVYTPLVALLGCAPILILAVINFVVYRKFTVWHSSSETAPARRKQVLLALIPASLAFAYGAAAATFYWQDTKSLYLHCEITKAEKAEDVGASFLFGIRHVDPWGPSRSDEYWAFEGAGWKSEYALDLGIAAWDFEAGEWTDLLGPFEYHPQSDWSDRRDGGLIVREDAFISRKWLPLLGLDREQTGLFERIKREGLLEIDGSYYKPVDKLVINRQTGAFAHEGGYEGVCKETYAPRATAKAAPKTVNKF